MFAGERHDRIDQRQARPRCSFGVVLMRTRIAEIDGSAVADPFGHVTVKALDRGRDRALGGADQLGHVLGIELGRQRAQADKVAEHHRHVPALGALAGGRHQRRRCIRRGKFADGAQNPQPVSERNTEVSQALIREFGKRVSVDPVFSKCAFVVIEAEAA